MEEQTATTDEMSRHITAGSGRGASLGVDEMHRLLTSAHTGDSRSEAAVLEHLRRAATDRGPAVTLEGEVARLKQLVDRFAY